MARKRFFTMGISLTTEKDFILRIRAVRILTGKDKVMFVDIRRKGSRSRNGMPFWQNVILHTIGYEDGILGTIAHELSNHYGSTQAGLKRYHSALQDEIGAGYTVGEEFERIKDYIEKDRYAVILLCSCGKAFKPNGKSWNCHRVPLALELLDDLGDEWEVEHL